MNREVFRHYDIMTVGEVAFAVWTAESRLRHPSWKGVRDDLEPDDVVVEP